MNKPHPLSRLALNSASADPETFGHFCVALNAAQDGAAPEWVELIPAGELVIGLDGRKWIMTDAQKVVDASNALIRTDGDSPIDKEHLMFLRDGDGEAYGWVKEYRLAANGSIEGRVEWTDLGIEAVSRKHYRFVSVAFDFDYNTMEVMVVKGGGLTNRKNLRVAALNNTQPNTEENMDPKLMAALGLVPTGDQAKDTAAALNAIQQLQSAHATALNAQKDLVPRADLQTALNAKDALQAKIDQINADTFKAKVETAVNAAVVAGKVTPGTKQYHLDTIKTPEALNSFEATYGKAPALMPEAAAAPDGSPDEQTALNAAELEIAAVFGNTAEDLKKYGK
jgi:phage I-like protein